MSTKTIAFKQPVGLEKPVEDWVTTRAQPQEPASPTKRLTVDVSADVHRRLKVHCATAGRQISDVVRDLLEREFPA